MKFGAKIVTSEVILTSWPTLQCSFFFWKVDTNSAGQGILCFYGTRRFITVFTKSCQL